AFRTLAATRPVGGESCVAARSPHGGLRRRPIRGRPTRRLWHPACDADSPVRTALVLLALATALRTAVAAPVVVVRAGDPSALGLPFSAFSNPAIDDRGHVAFVANSAVVFGSSGGGIVHRLGAGGGVVGRTRPGGGPAGPR